MNNKLLYFTESIWCERSNAPSWVSN